MPELRGEEAGSLAELRATLSAALELGKRADLDFGAEVACRGLGVAVRLGAGASRCSWPRATRGLPGTSRRQLRNHSHAWGPADLAPRA
eukprot:6890980-Pyramimonas_sp.AAC.1